MLQPYPHIELDESGVPHIAGTRIKVIEVALDRIAYHWDADEILRQHPQLSLAGIHAALAYFYDHQDQMEREIAEQLKRVEQVFRGLPPSPAQAKVLSAKLQKQTTRAAS